MERSDGHLERRRQILDAALRVFSERGFGGASIRRISDAAGLNSPPLVYWYFESKSDLFAATLEHYSALARGFAFGDRMEVSPDELLPQLALAELRVFEDPALSRLLRVAVAEAALDPATGERYFATLRGEALDFLTSYLDRWSRRTNVRGFRPRIEARAFFGALFFYVLNREVLPGFGGQLPDRDEYAGAVARRLLDRLVAAGAQAPPSGVPGRALPRVDDQDQPRRREAPVSPARPVETDDERTAEPPFDRHGARDEAEAPPLPVEGVSGGAAVGPERGVGPAEPRPGDGSPTSVEPESPIRPEAAEGAAPAAAFGHGTDFEEERPAASEGDLALEELVQARTEGQGPGDGEVEGDGAGTDRGSEKDERRDHGDWPVGLFDELYRETKTLEPSPLGTPPDLSPRPEIPLFDPATSRRAERAPRGVPMSRETSREDDAGAEPEDVSVQGRPPWVARGERLRDEEERRIAGSESAETQRAEEAEGPEPPEPVVAGLETDRAPSPTLGRPSPAEPPASGDASEPRREVGGVRKALFFVLPVRGHVLAALPVAQELTSRGEEVVFYTTEEFEGLVRGAGVGFRALDEEFALPGELSEGYFAAPRAMRPAVIRSIADTLRGVGRLAGWAGSEGADYAVYDPLCPWGRLVPEALGLPLVALYPSFVARENSPLARRLLPNLEGTPPPALVMPMVRLRWELREARTALGLPRLGPADLLLRPGDLSIVTLPEAFQPPTGGTLDERFVFVGPSILQRDERAYFSLKDIEARPTVFVSLGAAYDERTAGLYRACLDAFASSRWLVVMETGPGTDSALLGQAPPNVIAWPRVPRLEVLRRCDVFVTDGDIGATMEALWFGVPLVVAPRTPEQDVVAERVTELQMGLVLDPKTTSGEDLREAVDAVGAEPSYHAGLADLWVAARQAGGPRLAADSIQSFVQRARASS